jgi:hypothetical protein
MKTESQSVEVIEENGNITGTITIEKDGDVKRIPLNKE